MPERFWKNILEYALFLPLATLVRLLPRNAALAFGRHLGDLSRHLQGKRLGTARKNLSLAFPEMPQKELEQTLKAVFRNLAVNGVEMLRVDKFGGESDFQTYFRIRGAEHLREAYALDRGVLLMTGHFGFWESVSFLMSRLGYPTDFVAKRMKNPYVDRYLRGIRESGGCRFLESKRGARRIVRSLEEKRVVVLAMDQHISPREAVVVDFFGRPAYTTPIIARIAMKYGVPVVPFFVRRTEDDLFEVTFEPMLLLKDDVAKEAVVENTALLTARTEAGVRRDITQWFWVHRRWRVPQPPAKETP